MIIIYYFMFLAFIIILDIGDIVIFIIVNFATCYCLLGHFIAIIIIIITDIDVVIVVVIVIAIIILSSL